MNPVNPATVVRRASHDLGDADDSSAHDLAASSSGGIDVADKSLLMDYAYDEFCDRIAQGDEIDPDEFCERFPDCKSSLHRLLDAHRFIHENQQLLRNLQQVDWPDAGQSFLGFTLLRELGRGAFARVYLARETAIGNRLVAVKISRYGAEEASMLGRLDHPAARRPAFRRRVEPERPRPGPAVRRRRAVRLQDAPPARARRLCLRVHGRAGAPRRPAGRPEGVGAGRQRAADVDPVAAHEHRADLLAASARSATGDLHAVFGRNHPVRCN